jgi:hypothetical protein
MTRRKVDTITDGDGMTETRWITEAGGPYSEPLIYQLLQEANRAGHEGWELVGWVRDKRPLVSTQRVGLQLRRWDDTGR